MGLDEPDQITKLRVLSGFIIRAPMAAQIRLDV
jgi:hypothetical protein